MSPPGEAGKIRQQKFAAPYPAVGTKSRAIQGHAQNLAAQMIFRHTTGDMRMVVLHTDLAAQSLDAIAMRVLM